MLHQEVEMRAMLSKVQREKIYAHLMANGGYQGAKQLKDIYFCKKEVQSFEEVQMAEIGSFSLRLREYKDGKVHKIELNTKVINRYNDHHSWEEHETSVSSFEETKAILQAIGFKTFFTIEKTRHSFTDGDITFNIEDIKDFKPILEVEILTTQEESEAAKKRIVTLLEGLGIAHTQIVPKSVTHILMRERATF